MQWSESSNRGSAAAGQFATPSWVARLLCSRLRKTPHIAADLGVGKGALALALLDRFPETPIIGIDKHALPHNDQAMMSTYGMQLVTRDISRPTFSAWFHRQFGEVDVIVSNPPFTYIENAPAIQQLLTSEGFGNNKRAKNQRLDLVFLSHARKLLSHDGEMAFILPTSAFAMVKSIANLQVLMDHFGLQEIITLPPNLYQDAEVETAILVFRPSSRASACRKFAFYNARNESKLEFVGRYSSASVIQEVRVAAENAVSGVPVPNTIEGIGGTIARGKHSSNALMRQGISHFHTTSFQNYPTSHITFKRSGQPGVEVLDTPAEEGDILIPRVGTRCLGRAAIIVSGNQYISDCVYRISTPAAKRHKIWEFISSEAGRSWQMSLARGTCAKFITQQDLLSAALPHAIQ